jgi:putative amide transporter protein
MWLGLVLLYVGAVLSLNGLWMLGRIGDREIAIINILVGLLCLRVAHEHAFGPAADAASVQQAAWSLLFAFTYLWVAYNRLTGNDGRGLGWFSLFVAITVLPVGISALRQAHDVWSLWLAVSWVAWSGLWWLYYQLLARQKNWIRPIALITIAQGVLTGWLPGYLMLTSHWG